MGFLDKEIYENTSALLLMEKQDFIERHISQGAGNMSKMEE